MWSSPLDRRVVTRCSEYYERCWRGVSSCLTERYVERGAVEPASGPEMVLREREGDVEEKKEFQEGGVSSYAPRLS